MYGHRRAYAALCGTIRVMLEMGASGIIPYTDTYITPLHGPKD